MGAADYHCRVLERAGPGRHSGVVIGVGQVEPGAARPKRRPRDWPSPGVAGLSRRVVLQGTSCYGQAARLRASLPGKNLVHAGTAVRALAPGSGPPILHRYHVRLGHRLLGLALNAVSCRLHLDPSLANSSLPRSGGVNHSYRPLAHSALLLPAERRLPKPSGCATLWRREACGWMFASRSASAAYGSAGRRRPPMRAGTEKLFSILAGAARLESSRNYRTSSMLYCKCLSGKAVLPGGT
jgi:hypothetical protein